jgi:two-component system chemotaxis response regulator CheY
VEDDYVRAEEYKLTLLLHGFSVDVAPDGEAGIQRVTRGDVPAAIVLDLGRPRVDRQMPRRDGLDMVSVLRAIATTESVPIVALASDPQDFNDVLDRGATACLARWRSTTTDLMDRLDEILQRLRY